MITLTIDRNDIDHAKRACAEYDIEVYFSEVADNENKTLMVIPKDLPAYEVWYLGRNFQLKISEANFKAFL